MNASKVRIRRAIIIWISLCLLNIASCIVALSYVFSFENKAPGLLLSVFGPIAVIFSHPVIFIQNILPLGFPIDTMLGSMVVSMIETAILQAYMKYRSRPKRVIPEQIRIQNRTHTVIKKIITALIWIIFLYGIYTFIPESYGASHEHDYNVWFYFIILSVFATIIILTSWIIVLKIMPSKQKTEAQKSE